MNRIVEAVGILSILYIPVAVPLGEAGKEIAYVASRRDRLRVLGS